MKHGHQGGFIEGLIVAIGLLAILILFILPKNLPGPTSSLPNFFGGGADVKFEPPETTSLDKNVSINTGNASYSIQPFDEYIELVNHSDKPINITGWTLKNAKGERTYVVGSSEQHFASDVVTIPQGAYILSPTGANNLENIVLKQNESAIITTGSTGVATPYRITNFKENICTGYIQNLPSYSFTPSMQTNCVSPRNEPGVKNLDTRCQDYIGQMSSCRTPKFDTVDNRGDICYGCVDGDSTLSSSCVAFIKSHFSYSGCLAFHQNDSNFSGNRWRIYLGKPWELWAKSYETISLFDSTGKLVDFKSY